MIVKTHIAIALVLIVISNVWAKEDPRYPVSQIPEELRTGAYAVVREDDMAFTILSKSSATLRTHFVVTIFNEKGKHFARQSVWYDKLRKITSLKAQVWDANGNLIKRLKSSEIPDRSAFDGMYDDTRVKVIDLIQGRYPYTVEVEYEVAYKFLFHIDGSAINQYEDVAVQRAIYRLSYPEALKPRYKAHNIDKEPALQKDNGVQTLTWEFANLKARKFEPYSRYSDHIMRIEAAPSAFEYEGYAGTMNTWNEFGKWIASLNKGRDGLPEETKAKVKQLTANLATREEKVKAVYEYLQNRTRYVSIQLGIGGHQPFDAMVVDKTGYGDCKALSNYMVAMLKTIGIESHYTLIFAGPSRRPLEEDFPSSQFNHAIVAVPNGRDTLWLECTSQTNPFGFQGTFTGDRKALLITNDGAKVVRTTRYPADLNVQSTLAEVKVGATGAATATVKRSFSGLQYENEDLNHYLTRDHDSQQKWVQNHLDIPSYDLQSFSIRNIKDKIPTAVLDLELQMDRFASVSGKRLFFTPNLMNRIRTVPERVENRQSNVVLNSAFLDIDTVRYLLPEEIYPEFLPKPVTISSRFGEYEATFTVDEGNLLYIRRWKMNGGEFPASSYDELIEFYRNVSKADNVKMVFMTKT